jgi:hypothetical protein
VHLGPTPGKSVRNTQSSSATPDSECSSSHRQVGIHLYSSTGQRRGKTRSGAAGTVKSLLWSSLRMTLNLNCEAVAGSSGHATMRAVRDHLASARAAPGSSVALLCRNRPIVTILRSGNCFRRRTRRRFVDQGQGHYPGAPGVPGVPGIPGYLANRWRWDTLAKRSAPCRLRSFVHHPDIDTGLDHGGRPFQATSRLHSNAPRLLPRTRNMRTLAGRQAHDCRNEHPDPYSLAIFSDPGNPQ